MIILRCVRYRRVYVLLCLCVTVFVITSLMVTDVLFTDTRQALQKLRFVYYIKNNKGSKANYSTPSVESLVEVYRSKEQTFGSKFILKDSQPYPEFVKELHSINKSRALSHLNLENYKILSHSTDKGMSSWQRFYQEINQYELYDPYTSDTVDELLKDLSTSRINCSDLMKQYAETVIMLQLDNGIYAVFKPMRYPRDYETQPDVFYFLELYRHYSEIAAFHLDRVLGFHRVPPTVGRKVNLTHDLLNNKRISSYISPAGNLCIKSKCKLSIDRECSACGNPVILEASLTISLPGINGPSTDEKDIHPWSRSYNITKTAWELDDDYCQSHVKVDPRFKHGRTLLDLIDMSVFDFLIGNMDRSHFVRFREFDEDSFVLYTENAKGFGKAKYDCMSCLAPLRQCCQIRLSTLAKLIKLYQGPDSLSQVMRTSLNSDPLSPILLEPHLDALDRRLVIVIKTVSDCIHNNRSWEDVVIADGIS